LHSWSHDEQASMLQFNRLDRAFAFAHFEAASCPNRVLKNSEIL
jgi:hypothetical protein